MSVRILARNWRLNSIENLSDNLDAETPCELRWYATSLVVVYIDTWKLISTYFSHLAPKLRVLIGAISWHAIE